MAATKFDFDNDFLSRLPFSIRAETLAFLFFLLFCNVDSVHANFETCVVTCREYYPQNIMFDKRVHRGNSYAAMVIPAGTSHDTMIMEKRQT